MSTSFEPDEEPYRGRSAGARVVALVVLIALVLTYAGVNVVSFLRSEPAAPLPGQVDPRGFKFLSIDPATKLPVHYDPCTPLAYVINPANAPRGGIEDVQGAIALAAEATGIRFAYEGEADEPLAQDRAPVQDDRYGHRWAPLLIGWIPFDSRIFEVDDVGVAGSLIEANPSGRWVYVTGSIFLNGADQLDNGFRPGKTWGKVVLHELGHVLGLGHVTDPAQVMNPNLVSSPAAWGTGDLAGLRQLGALAGCIEVPTVP